MPFVDTSSTLPRHFSDTSPMPPKEEMCAIDTEIGRAEEAAEGFGSLDTTDEKMLRGMSDVPYPIIASFSQACLGRV